MSSAAKEQKHAQALCGSEKGRAYAGDDHEAEHPALRHDIHGMYRRSGDAGNKPYLPKNDPKYADSGENRNVFPRHNSHHAQEVWRGGGAGKLF